MKMSKKQMKQADQVLRTLMFVVCGTGIGISLMAEAHQGVLPQARIEMVLGVIISGLGVWVATRKEPKKVAYKPKVVVSTPETRALARKARMNTVYGMNLPNLSRLAKK